MKEPSPRLPTALLRATLAGALLLFARLSMADPLHPVPGSPSWRHEFSGWLFPLQLAGFERQGPPWQIEGGDEVAARYSAPGSPGASFVVEILRDAGQPQQWSVRITATARTADEFARLDGAVRALPWDSLGSAAGAN